MISKMLPALYMIVALILKQQTTFFTVNRFLQKIYKKLLLDLFKIDVALKNLNDELLLDVLLFGSDKDKDTVNKEILIHAINFLKTVNALKDHCLVVGTTLWPPYLISLLHSHLFWKCNVETLLAYYRFLQLSICPLYF